MTDEAIKQDTTFPEVGKQYKFSGCDVRVREVKKRGRGYQVFWETLNGTLGSRARLKDWQAGAQAA